MTQFLSRWWMNANADALGNEADYVRHRNAWNPPGQLLMNGLHGSTDQNTVVRLANSLRQRGGNTIYRPYEADEREKRFWTYRTPEAHQKFIRDMQAPSWLWFQVGNEPAFDKGERSVRAMCHWLAERIRLAVPAGERLVVYNPSVAGFERWQIDAGWYDELLTELARYAHIIVDGWPQIILGSHSTCYWMGLAAVHCAGRNPADLVYPERLQKKDWPTREQVFDADTGDNYILFRDFWFVERTRKLQREQHVNEGIDIKIATTECGPERLPNIEKQFPDVVAKIDELCWRRWRGVRTVKDYYEWVFPDQTAAESICDDMALIETLAPDVYLAFLAYSWTWHNAAPDYWRRDYNWGEMNDVLTIWPTRAPQKEKPVPTAIPFPDNLGSPEQRVLSAASGESVVHGREGPGTDYALILDVPDGAIVKVWKESAREAAGRDWYPVEYNGRRFWLAQVGYDPITRMLRTFEQQFLPIITPPEQGSGNGDQGSAPEPTPVPAPPPAPSDPPAPEPTPAPDEEMKALLRELIASMNRVAAVLEKMADIESAWMPKIVNQGGNS